MVQSHHPFYKDYLIHSIFYIKIIIILGFIVWILLSCFYHTIPIIVQHFNDCLFYIILVLTMFLIVILLVGFRNYLPSLWKMYWKAQPQKPSISEYYVSLALWLLLYFLIICFALIIGKMFKKPESVYMIS